MVVNKAPIPAKRLAPTITPKDIKKLYIILLGRKDIFVTLSFRYFPISYDKDKGFILLDLILKVVHRHKDFSINFYMKLVAGEIIWSGI